MPEMNIDRHIYDMIVIGGGPAGYTAALYAARAGLDTVVVERLAAGGQMALTDQIDNYPGFDEGISGYLLGEKMRAGAERFGVKTEVGEVMSVDLAQTIKQVGLAENMLLGRTVVLSTGANPRKLGVEGEDELIGRGVSYCATCDGMFYRGKRVAVIGGGNSAVEDAIILSRIASEVYLIHRRDTLRAEKIYRDKISTIENVKFIWDSSVAELIYDERLSSVSVLDQKTGKKLDLGCDGLFISIGRVPATELVRGKLQLDSAGYIESDETTCTDIPGVFAVGDVRAKAVRQIVTAVSDGANAVYYAEKYLNLN